MNQLRQGSPRPFSFCFAKQVCARVVSPFSEILQYAALKQNRRSKYKKTNRETEDQQDGKESAAEGLISNYPRQQGQTLFPLLYHGDTH